MSLRDAEPFFSVRQQYTSVRERKTAENSVFNCVIFKLQHMTQTCRENKLHNNDEPPSSRRRTVSSDKRDRRGLLRRTQRSGVVEPLPHRCGLQRRRHGAGRARAHMQRHLQQLHPHGAALRAAVHSGGQGPTRELLQQR